MKKLFILLLALLSFSAMAQHGNFTDIRLINGSAGLAGTTNGTIYFDTGSGTFKFRQGGSWMELATPITYSAGSGLSLSGTTFNLGNALTANTNITGNSDAYDFNMYNLDEFYLQGDNNSSIQTTGSAITFFKAY